MAGAGLAIPFPGAVTFLYTGPHKTLLDELHRCVGAWMLQILDGLEH
jgi:hypothetical protein